MGFGLVMHASQRPASSIIGKVALRDLGVQSVLLEFLLTEGSSKETALVFDRLDFDEAGSPEQSFLEDHV